MSGYLLSQHTLVIWLNLTFQYSLKPHLNHPGKCWVTQGENLYKIGPNKFMGAWEGCVLIGMHFSQTKNARLLNFMGKLTCCPAINQIIHGTYILDMSVWPLTQDERQLFYFRLVTVRHARPTRWSCLPARRTSRPSSRRTPRSTPLSSLKMSHSRWDLSKFQVLHKNCLTI